MFVLSSLFLGAIVGWFVSAMTTSADLRALFNIVVASVGALASSLLVWTFGAGGIGALMLAVTVLGAVGLLFTVRRWVWF